MKKNELFDELIENYRRLVSERYNYASLKATFDLNSAVKKELVERVKVYFLKYVYPSYEQRLILNKAFDDLDKHIKNPTHLLKLLGDVPGIILKFGWQFPKAIKAGLHTLKSFQAASKFEKDLMKTAEKKKIKAPIDEQTFEEIIADLDEKELHDFINGFEDLLKALTDTKLLKKTNEILNQLAGAMSKDSFYSKEEVQAVLVGKEILEQGYILFESMNEDEKKAMIDLIVQAENHFINELKLKYS